MDRIVLFWFLSLLTASFCYWMPTYAQEKGRDQDVSSFFDNLSESDKDFVTLKQDASLDLDDDVQPYRRKRVCAVGGGMSPQCATAVVDQQMKMRERLMRGDGPGKRSFQTMNADEENAAVSQAPDNTVLNRRLEEAVEEKKGLQLLMKILNQMQSDLTYEKKRACQFNLGGHCSTESAAFVADRWHYLDSPLSPGRKRSQRAAGITRKLVKGKFFPDTE